MDIQVILPPSSQARIKRQLEELDCFFVPSLSGRVDIDSYALKLAEKARIIYARNGSVDCGHCAYYINESEEFAYITSIGVNPNYHNRGIGRRMIERMHLECHEMGVDCIRLKVHCGNIKAIAFYKNVGFEGASIEGEWITMQGIIES